MELRWKLVTYARNIKITRIRKVEARTTSVLKRKVVTFVVLILKYIHIFNIHGPKNICIIIVQRIGVVLYGFHFVHIVQLVRFLKPDVNYNGVKIWSHINFQLKMILWAHLGQLCMLLRLVHFTLTSKWLHLVQCYTQCGVKWWKRKAPCCKHIQVEYCQAQPKSMVSLKIKVAPFQDEKVND